MGDWGWNGRSVGEAVIKICLWNWKASQISTSSWTKLSRAVAGPSSLRKMCRAVYSQDVGGYWEKATLEWILIKNLSNAKLRTDSHSPHSLDQRHRIPAFPIVFYVPIRNSFISRPANHSFRLMASVANSETTTDHIKWRRRNKSRNLLNAWSRVRESVLDILSTFIQSTTIYRRILVSWVVYYCRWMVVEQGIFYYCYPPPEIDSPPSHAADKDRLRSVHYLRCVERVGQRCIVFFRRRRSCRIEVETLIWPRIGRKTTTLFGTKNAELCLRGR